MSIFARNLRFLRNQRGLNQKDISILFKKRGNTVGNWENSKSEPSIGELVKLAAYFKIDLHQLLHTDLQKETLNALDSTSLSSASETVPANLYPLNDLTGSVAHDGSSDSFWLILRELRAIREKLDDLKLVHESGMQKPGSDKSNH